MCQTDNNPTKEQNTAEDNQLVLNTAKNSRSGGGPYIALNQNVYLLSKNGRHTKLKHI